MHSSVHESNKYSDVWSTSRISRLSRIKVSEYSNSTHGLTPTTLSGCTKEISQG